VKQTRPGHLARSGELRLIQTAQSRAALSQKQSARFVIAKLKPAPLNWKPKAST